MTTASLRVETVAIGDELLTGKTTDTNSTFVANALFGHGFRLERVTVIPDDSGVIRSTLEDCAQRAERVVVFGGLGPTSDDKTAEVVAEWLGCELTRDEPSEKRLREYYARRNRPVTPQGLKQVLYPSAAVALPNPRGMAPGFALTRGKTRYYFLPGVPSEMKAIFEQSILPEFEKLGGEVTAHTWRCLGIPESELQIAMDPVEAELPAGAWLGYRTRHPENHLTLYCRPEASGVYGALRARISAILQPWCYTQNEKELEEIVGQACRDQHLRLALAESCTAGLTVHRLTRVAGSSDYVWGGVAVYQLAAKAELLGVEARSAEAAVSRECSRQLAQAVRARAGVEVSAAITGYMGPGVGTTSDPPGTIYACVDNRGKLFERRIVIFARTRLEMQWAAATHLLNLIRESLGA